jgi:hypothetical protein
MWDSVRFAARTVNGAGTGAGGQVQVRYVCERGHRPVEHGVLEVDVTGTRWVQRHADSRLQRMAECFLESYIAKKKRLEVTRAAS